MPIYEYRCEACGEVFEVLVRSRSRQTGPRCPKCGSAEVTKAMSLFGLGRATGRRANEAACAPGST
jgi:putative FmdB family regulatory protein